MAMDMKDPKPQREAPGWTGGLAAVIWDSAPRHAPQMALGSQEEPGPGLQDHVLHLDPLTRIGLLARRLLPASGAADKHLLGPCGQAAADRNLGQM